MSCLAGLHYCLGWCLTCGLSSCGLALTAWSVCLEQGGSLCSAVCFAPCFVWVPLADWFGRGKILVNEPSGPVSTTALTCSSWLGAWLVA